MAEEQTDTTRALRMLGRLFRIVRESREETQEQIAERLGINKSRISDVDRGQSDAQFSSLDRYARALGFKGGVIELIETRGDPQTGDLLRAWRAVPPDEQSRADALKLVVDYAFPKRAPDATSTARRPSAAKHSRKAKAK